MNRDGGGDGRHLLVVVEFNEHIELGIIFGAYCGGLLDSGRLRARSLTSTGGVPVLHLETAYLELSATAHHDEFDVLVSPLSSPPLQPLGLRCLVAVFAQAVPPRWDPAGQLWGLVENLDAIERAATSEASWHELQEAAGEACASYRVGPTQAGALALDVPH